MATERRGIYGYYHGSEYIESELLSEFEMQVNAKYIFSYLTSKGWTLNAIAGLLGNLQAESSINPGRWQSDNVGNTSNGYGLVQWTPATKYFDWCSERGYSDPSEMDNNLARIIYEVENSLQWISTNSYTLSFKDFTTSILPTSELAKAFLLNYERPADQSSTVQEYRGSLANNWYSYLSGETPSNPDTPTTNIKNKRKYKFLLYTAGKRRNEWINNN